MSVEVVTFDPRDAAQSFEDPLTWKPTRNAALIAASVFLVPGWPASLFDFEALKVSADECDREDAA